MQDPQVPARALPATSSAPRRGFAFAFGAFVLSLGALFAIYLALAAPGKWFPGANVLTWSARDLALSRGNGQLRDDAWTLVGPDASGVMLLSVPTNFLASDYPVIAWDADGVSPGASVQLLCRTDYEPNRLQGATLRVDAGRLLPTSMAKNPGWIGHITGIAILVRGTVTQPLHVHGVSAKPMGVIAIALDRLREWTTFEGWSQSSINTVVGGADTQDLPLPLLLAAAVGVASAFVYYYARKRPGAYALSFAATVAGLALVAWALADLRWVVNLAEQTAITYERYAGKSWRDKQLAADDGPLFAFIERTRSTLPPGTARVFVAADADFFRGRAAYHLYPYNVMYDPFRNTMPAPSQLRKGDWLVVYQRNGVQYDAAQKRLRWDGNAPVPAELRLFEDGAALYEIL